MEQYISKSALVAEIKRRINLYKGLSAETVNPNRIDEEEQILSFINTLEVEVNDVDLEKYYHEFLEKEWFGNSHYRTVSEMMAFTAKHFFELGMAVSNKAQKGEAV